MRILVQAGAIAGAVALSQFPEFSQQYVQRLSGAVDELRAVTFAFDTAAKVGGLSRQEALAELKGTRFGDQFSDDMRARIYRFERLNADHRALAGAQPMQRLARFWRFRDADLARRTWEQYQPAIPVTLEGLTFAGIGYAGGWLLVALTFGALFGRRRLRWA